MTLIPSLLSNFVSIASEGNFLGAFRRYLPLATLAMVGSAIGTQTLIFTNSEFFKALLGIAIIAYLLAKKIKLNLPWVNQYPSLSKVIFGLSARVFSSEFSLE